MLTGIDHIVIAVPDLDSTVAAYGRLGFHVAPGGHYEGHGGRHPCATITLDAQRVEFIATGGTGDGTPGIREIAIASNDLEADTGAMRERGAAIGDPEMVERIADDGGRMRWHSASPLGDRPLPLRFVQHLSPDDTQSTQAPRAEHPNGAMEFDSLYIATPDLATSTEGYRRFFGDIEVRPLQGIVIRARMMMFPFGSSQLFLAEPDGPGPAADALAARGPGPFQAIYRTSSIEETGRWLESQGVTPASRGRRSTGETTIVISPADALGTNTGFVGGEP